jgi:hypothetical protein
VIAANEILVRLNPDRKATSGSKLSTTRTIAPALGISAAAPVKNVTALERKVVAIETKATAPAKKEASP